MSRSKPSQQPRRKVEQEKTERKLQGSWAKAHHNVAHLGMRTPASSDSPRHFKLEPSRNRRRPPLPAKLIGNMGPGQKRNCSENAAEACERGPARKLVFRHSKEESEQSHQWPGPSFSKVVQESLHNHRAGRAGPAQALNHASSGL